MEIFKTENLNFTYSGNNTPTLRDVSVSIKKGEFVTIFGSTGSGKSTFLKLLKKEVSPKGNISGNILFKGKKLSEISQKDSASLIGYVMQRPEMQIVTDKVWHELAFGLENLNVPKNLISLKIAEMASYFGIEKMFYTNVSSLSGGQKQLLNLASAMVMDPEILILDEPTSQLDPIAASEFISTLKKINNELGITVVIVEHKLEELIPISDRLMIFERGKVVYFDSPGNISDAFNKNMDYMKFLPVPLRLYHAVDGEGKLPLSIREGREFLENNWSDCSFESNDECENETVDGKVALEFKNIFFRYGKELPDILNSFNLKIYENEIFCILGGNGSGKSTFLSLATGINRAYSGNIRILGKKISEYKNGSLYNNCISYLPQDVQTLFTSDTVLEEMKDCQYIHHKLETLRNKHPYDLSGGEQQLLGLSKILKNNPQIVFLDEPTKGIDPVIRDDIIEFIKKLKKEGKTIVIVTHNVDFAANCADRCALIFNGRIVAVENRKRFFAGNNFYTTVANKISRDVFANVVTLDELISRCEKGKKNDYN